MDTTAAFVLLYCRATGCIARVLPTKHLPRPKKRGAGMTKGLAEPWMPPGGKIKARETPRQAAERELQEETGVVLSTMDATLVSELPIPGIRAQLFVFSIPDEVALAPGKDISQAAWAARDAVYDKAHFVMQRALYVGAGPLWAVGPGCDFTLNQPPAGKKQRQQ